jgi:hypothetical protein
MYKLCRHIRTSGDRCRSAALPSRHFCHYHLIQRQPAAGGPAAAVPLDLPPIEDRFAVQVAISRILSALAAGAIDPRHAGLFLYGVQIAAANLPRETSALSPFNPVRRVVRNRHNEQLAEAETIYEDREKKGHKRGCECAACTGLQTDDPHHPDCTCGECHYFTREEDLSPAEEPIGEIVSETTEHAEKEEPPAKPETLTLQAVADDSGKPSKMGAPFLRSKGGNHKSSLPDSEIIPCH